MEVDFSPFSLDDVMLNHVHTVTAQKAQEKGCIYRSMCHQMCRVIWSAMPCLRADFGESGEQMIKFTEQGNVKLSLENLSHDPDTSSMPVLLRFAIGDTGIGMTEDQIERLFPPGTQADSSTSPEVRWYGLGSVDLANWSNCSVVRLASLTNLAKVPASNSLCLAMYVPQLICWRWEERSLPPKFYADTLVLLVETMRLINKLRSSCLDTVGIKVDVASGGQEALDKLAKGTSSTYDLIFDGFGNAGHGRHWPHV